MSLASALQVSYLKSKLSFFKSRLLPRSSLRSQLSALFFQVSPSSHLKSQVSAFRSLFQVSDLSFQVSLPPVFDFDEFEPSVQDESVQLLNAGGVVALDDDAVVGDGFDLSAVFASE